MSYSIEEIKDSIAYCGLVCKLCSAGKTGKCKGCREKCDGCSIKECGKTRNINGCWECDGFPCDESMFRNRRNRAFVQCAKEEGIHKLAKYLKKNSDQGVNYHNEDGTSGDYDRLDSEYEILQLLRKKEKPYEKCPIYGSKRFVFRMIEEKDAEDLLECYSNSESNKLFNSDNCTGNFLCKSLEEMENSIKSWIDQYHSKSFVRFSIIDRLNDKAIGTIEFFAKPVDYKGIFKVGLLRLDVAPKYENEEAIVEMLDIINNNFYDDFEVKHIITKAIPVAKQRIAALKKEGFIELEDKTIVPFDSYLIREEHL